MKPTQQDLQDVLAEARRFATPHPEDRARATQALEAQLGPEVVHDVTPNGAAAPGTGFAPAPAPITSGVAPASKLAPSSRLPALVLRPSGALSAGVALIGLGFAIGYGVGSRAPTSRDTTPSAVALPSLAASVPPRDAASSTPPAMTPPAMTPPATTPPATTPPATTPPSAVPSDLALQDRVVPPARVAAETSRPVPTASPPAPAAAHPRRTPRGGSATATRADQLTLREVLARLRQAHAALEDGRAALALIELEALDRSGGELLREEREVTRILAFCALGNTEHARSAARALSVGPDSIYARRLEASCAGEAVPPRR